MQVRRCVVVLLAGLASTATLAGEGLTCIQQPMFWFAGQRQRILIQTPADCGKLEVVVPEGLELFDRWPHKPGDTRQRFYLRAERPLKDAKLVFSSGAYRLELPVEVWPWADALTQRRVIDGVQLPRIFPLDGKDEPKAGPTIVARARLDELRKQGLAEEVRAEAEKGLPDLQRLYDRFASSTFPRIAYVNPKGNFIGCPICGRKVFEGRSGHYPWVRDEWNRPYKIQCPECETWFPSNDFAKGDMTSGKYPDDGWGYFDDKGNCYSFVAYYALWNYHGPYDSIPIIWADRYARSGDRRYGRAGAVALFRIAEQYVNLAWNIHMRNLFNRRYFWINDHPIQQGMYKLFMNQYLYVDGVWENSKIDKNARAFDMLWDYFQAEDSELLRFLQAQHHPELETMADVRRFIEVGCFRVLAQAILEGAVRGNRPAGPLSAMRLALALNSLRSIDIVRWVFNGPGAMRDYLTNEFFIDGSVFESEGGYNKGHVGKTALVADLLKQIIDRRPDQYAQAKLPLITADPKFKYLYEFCAKFTLIDRTFAPIGDAGDVAGTDPQPICVGGSLPRAHWIAALRHFPDEVNFARALWDAGKGAPCDQLEDPELRRKVTETIKAHGPEANLPSQVLDGFGHAILRSGKGQHQRSMWVRYGQCYGHGHHDMHSIGFEALERFLLPELGYYRGEDYRGSWDNNWAIHYSVRMLGRSGRNYTGELAEGQKDIQRRGKGGLRLFADGGWAKVATAAKREHRIVDPPVCYELIPRDVMNRERTIALIDLSPEASYGVSIYRACGGVKHYWSFHGPRGTAERFGIEVKPQGRGTLAGPDEEYGQKWNTPWGQKHGHLRTFPLLYDVHRGVSKDIWGLTWDLKGHPDVHLRVHLVRPAGAKVALCKGKHPSDSGNPYELQWIMQEVNGPETLNTQFVTVLEAYKGDPLIDEVRRLTVTSTDAGRQPPVALQVVSGDRVDTIIHCDNPNLAVTTPNGVTMTGTFGVWSEVNGKLSRAFVAEGTKIGKGEQAFTAEAAAWTGKIVSADWSARKAIIDAPHREPASLAGRYARITNLGGNHDVTHRIVVARPVPQGVELTFELDPRVGEGTVAKVADGHVESSESLPLASYTYYMGKTLYNEDGSARYTLRGLPGSRRKRKYAYLDQELHPGVTAAELAEQFTDRDGDGNARFVIYDYGPGDTVTVPTIIVGSQEPD